MGYQVPPYLLRGELVAWGRQEGQTVTPLMSVLSLGVRADERRARVLQDRLWREFTGGERPLARMATFWRVDGADEAPQVVSLLGHRQCVLPLDRLTRREGLSEFLQALRPRGSRIDFVVYGGVKHDFGYGLALDLTTLEAHHDGLPRLLDAMDHVLGQLGAEVDALSSEDADDLSLHALRQLEAVACQGGVPIEPRVWRPESALVARITGQSLLTRADVVQRLNVLLDEQHRERIPSQDRPAEGGFILTRIMRVMATGRCSPWEAATALLQGQPMHVLQSVAWGGQLERGNTIEEDVRRVLESLGMEAPDQNRSIARLHAEPRGVLRTAWRGAAESLAKDIVCTLVDRMEGGWPHAEELLRDRKILHSRKPLGQALAELTLGRAGQWIALLGTEAGLDEDRHDSLQEVVVLLRRVDERLMPAVHDRRGPLPQDAAEPSQLCHDAMTVARDVLGGLPWHMQAPPVRGGAMHGDAWSHAEVALRELGVVPELGEEVGSRLIVWLDHDREATRLMRLP